MKKVVFAFLALAILSCGSSKDSIGEKVTLNGAYQLMSLQGDEEISDESLVFNFSPEENRITGETGCNGFSAKYTQENNVLSIGRAMSTRMFCEGKMEMENKIIAILEEVAKVEKDGKDIVFYTTDNKPLFILNKI